MFLSAVLPFYLGILAQSLLLLQEDFIAVYLYGVLFLAGLATFGFIPDKGENIYDLYSHLFIVSVIFSVMYAASFRQKILEGINKEVMTVWNLIFLYIILQHHSVFQNQILLALIVIPSLLVLCNLLFSFDYLYFWRVYFYLWFLIMIVVIASSYFAFDKINFFFTQGHGYFGTPIEMFFVGSSFLYLVVNFWFIISLIPLPGRDQTFKQRILNVKRDIADFASDYQEEKMNRRKAQLLLGILVVLIINFFYHFIPDTLFISILITLGPFTVKKFTTTVLPNKIEQSSSPS